MIKANKEIILSDESIVSKTLLIRLTGEEKEEMVANCDHLKSLKFSSNLPYAFTEHGAVMLASVLNSDRAIAVNIQIVRIFTQMREMLSTHKDVLLKLEQLEKKTTSHDADIQLIYKRNRMNLRGK